MYGIPVSLIVCIAGGIVFVLSNTNRRDIISAALSSDIAELGRLAFVAGLLAFLLGK
jgi:hypothetical protein